MSSIPVAISRATRQRTAVLCSLVIAFAAVYSLIAAVSPARAAVTATATYGTSGTDAFTVPIGVSTLTVTVVGAAGGSCDGVAGGQGASVTASGSVAPGEQFFVGVARPAVSVTSRRGSERAVGSAAAESAVRGPAADRVAAPVAQVEAAPPRSRSRRHLPAFRP
jgi:hypothetical protein